MQSLVPDTFPFRAKFQTPCWRYLCWVVVTLGHDVLYGVLIHDHWFFAPLILQAPQPITTGPEAIQISYLDVSTKLLIVRKASVGRQQQKMRLNAFQVFAFLECF